MILKNGRYFELAEKIKTENRRIVIYGAGMIGRIVVPSFIQRFGLEEYVECYVDMDGRKMGEKIRVGSYRFEVLHPDVLKMPIENLIILITNSKFYPIIEYLDKIRNLDSVEGYLIPLLQISETGKENPVAFKKMSQAPLIPRKIHYCWFGRRKMPEFLVRCMDTWKKLCPDYEIICWNEDNYDVERIPFTREAYYQKKYGFVTDAARLDILYENGGIYMDTDVSLIKNLDDLLYQPAFTGVEKWGNINTGGMAGAVPEHPMIKEMLEVRRQFHFLLEDGSLNMETNGLYETVPFLRYGMRIEDRLQRINGVTVYPSQVFHPYDYMSCQMKKNKDTYSIHHFYGGWMEKEDWLNKEKTQVEYSALLRRIEMSEG